MTNRQQTKKLLTPVFRVAFPELTDPARRRRTESDSPNKFVGDKYSVTALWRPAEFSVYEQGLWQALLSEINVSLVQSFGKSLKLILDGFGNDIRIVPRSGADKTYNGFGEGVMFAVLSSGAGQPPAALDAEEGRIQDDDMSDAFYPGCYARAVVNVYTWSYRGKGVSLRLLGLQKVRDAARLDGPDARGETVADRAASTMRRFAAKRRRSSAAASSFVSGTMV